jgi:thymidylate synthase
MLCWYLAGTNALDFITYYLPEHIEFAEGNFLFGGYGPRLFGWRGHNQFNDIADLLRRKPDSRQAVIQLFEASDLRGAHKDIPCTCTLQFMLRGNHLHLVTYMRSNDVDWGLPHDVFCFTMLQELMSKILSVELGTYKHAVGSLHLDDTSTNTAQKFLNEGWQATDMPMPAMPPGDPWPAVNSLLHAESEIRIHGTPDPLEIEKLDPYWQDIVRLLQVFQCWKKRDSDQIRAIRGRMASTVYDPFIVGKLRALL